MVKSTVAYSTRVACGARLPVRQTGGSRQGRACHLFGGGRDVQYVRQTLSDVSAHIGDVKRGFPDGRALRGMLFRNIPYGHWFSSRGCAAVLAREHDLAITTTMTTVQDGPGAPFSGLPIPSMAGVCGALEGMLSSRGLRGW